MRYPVEVEIPAVITLQGKVDADSPEEAQQVAEAEAAKIREEFSEIPILSGVWPERLGRATVSARAAAKGDAAVRVGR